MPLIEGPGGGQQEAPLTQILKSISPLRHEHARQQPIEASAKIVGGCLDGAMERSVTGFRGTLILRLECHHAEQESIEAPSPLIDARLTHPGL